MQSFYRRATNASSLAVVTGWLVFLFVICASILAADYSGSVYQVGYPALIPSWKPPGGPGFILGVYGTNIIGSSIVYWNGSPRETVDFTDRRLHVQIPASDIAEPGVATITVYTPDMGFSPPAEFKIKPLPPFLGSTVPISMPAESLGFVLMAIGTNSYYSNIGPFTKDSVIRWNGSDRKTTFIDHQHLQATILTSDLAVPGTAMISVAGPGGEAQARTFTITDPVPTVRLNVGLGGAAQHKRSTNADSTQTGYATITNSGFTPYGTAVFSFRNNNITVSEVAVPPSPASLKSRLFVEYRQATAVPGQSESGMIQIDTGIAIVNYGESVARITYTLRKLDAEIIAVGHGKIPAGNHEAKFISQLKDIAPDFTLPSDFQTETQFGSLEIESDQPLSILALRGTKNQRNDFLITTTPVTDLDRTSDQGLLHFPQFVDGGGYTTALILMNKSDETESGSLEILNDDGAPMRVKQAGGTEDSSFRYTIPAGGTYRFQTDGSPENAKAGWARVLPDTSTSTPVGLGIFSFNPQNVLVSESGISATMPIKNARVYVDLTDNHNTGLAMANPNDMDQEISIHAYEIDGTTGIGTTRAPLHLAAGGHSAMFVDQIVEELPPDFRGVLDLSSVSPFVALTIRALKNERNDFLMSTFPVADPEQQPLAPLLFPHIADGGGYATEFIFLSPSEASTIAIGMFGNAGNPLQ